MLITPTQMIIRLLTYLLLCLADRGAHVIAGTHLHLKDHHMLSDRFVAIAGDPLNHSLEDLYFAIEGLAVLGYEPNCDCNKIKAIPRSRYQTGMNEYYRTRIVSSCNCVVNVMMESIHLQFQEGNSESEDVAIAGSLQSEVQLSPSLRLFLYNQLLLGPAAPPLRLDAL